MSEQWKQFVEDPRTVCKYGKKCYQKNSQHIAKFKHPPDLKRKYHNENQGLKRTKVMGVLNASSSNLNENELNEEDSKAWHCLNSAISEENTSQDLQQDSSGQVLSPDDKETRSSVRNASQTSITETILVEFIRDTDCKKIIKLLFLTDMPSDFYSFWQFISKEKEAGIDILKMANLEAVGPFDVLAGTLPHIKEKDQYLVHWRFFYDPPEFQTIIKSKGKNEFHMGYFRDDPEENPVFVGSNDSSKNCIITPIADNILGALYLHLQSQKKSPFTAMSYQKVIDKLKSWADQHNFNLEKYDTRKRLTSTAVTKSFHGAGIVVPYNRKTQLGYRPLAERDANLKKLLANLSSSSSSEKKNSLLSELQPVITYANIAMDECDFGTGLELGIDLFCTGLAELDGTTLATLTAAYTLLNRQIFIKIIENHLKYRRRGGELSVLNLT